jgi:hypothetical protein
MWKRCNLTAVVVRGTILVGLLASSGRGQEVFVRGQLGLSGFVETSDAHRILEYLFPTDMPRRLVCLDAADVDDNGQVDITDALWVLNFIHCLGRPPQAPFPQCGLDTTQDALSCERFEACPEPSSPFEEALEAYFPHVAGCHFLSFVAT